MTKRKENKQIAHHNYDEDVDEEIADEINP